jgi:hypothetical protein
VGKIAGNGTNFRPHLNCCDPDVSHDYSPPAYRWSVNMSDIDVVMRPNERVHVPAHAEENVMSRDTVNRVAGHVQHLVRRVSWESS